MKINIVNYFNEEDYTALITKVIEVGEAVEGLMDNEISVVLVDNNYIKELNKNYRDKDYATDVLTFPDGTEGYLGDIIISIEKAQEQALELGHSFERELGFLTCHGFLHTLGYDHMTEEDEAVMIAKQEEIMNTADIRR